MVGPLGNLGGCQMMEMRDWDIAVGVGDPWPAGRSCIVVNSVGMLSVQPPAIDRIKTKYCTQVGKKLDP